MIAGVSNGAGAVQHTCAVLKESYIGCLHACFDSKPVPAQKSCSLEQHEQQWYNWLPANLVALVKQGSGASSVQHTCAVLQDTCMCCLHACFDSKPL